MVHENDIPDALAHRLHLLEPGLALVETNYHLKNPEGSRGFIDILAKDDSGSFVVIELKRSDSSARDALTELCKYVELLQRELGVPFAQLRAMLVSTHWSELRVPYSHFKRSWPHYLLGLHLQLDPDGVTPLSVSAVEALPELLERGLTPIHGWLAPLDEEDIAPTWGRLVSLAREVGADDLLGAHLAHEASGHALYVALGLLAPDDPRTTPLLALDVEEEDPGDELFQAEDEYALEEKAMTRLVEQHDGPWRVAYPEKFATLTEEHGWRTVQLFRAGVFSKQTRLFSDEDVEVMLAGDRGLGDVRFNGKSRPDNRQHWAVFRTHIARCLRETEPWLEGLTLWLDETEIQTPGRDVFVQVYNPGDLISHLIWSMRGERRLDQLVPSLQGAVDAPGEEGRLLHGVLTWNGREVSIESAFRDVYEDDAGWGIGRLAGGREKDRRLLAAWQLSYTLCEFRPHEEGALLVAEKGLLRRVPFIKGPGGPSPVGRLPLWDFLRAHDDDLGELLRRLANRIVVLGDSGTQLYVDCPGPGDGASGAE